MASVGTGVQLSTQSAIQPYKLAQAESNAAQAERRAASLRSQADAAQSDASRAQQNARAVEANATQAESTAVAARQGVATAKAAEDVGMNWAATYDRLAQVQSTVGKALDSALAVNGQGQITGQVVSETA
jgi:hypothetical protein